MSNDTSMPHRELQQIATKAGTSPFNMALPDVPGTLPSSYENTDLFRRYGVGEGEISEDRKHFSFHGEGFLLNEKRDSNFAGTYEFLIPLSSLGEPPPSAALPFNLHTLSINQMSHSAYGKERWDFDDGSSVLTVGSAVLHTAQILTGERVLWISSGKVVTKGCGKFEGSQGMKNSGICILIPEGESLQTATKVTFKSIDVFVLLRQEFIGQLPEPSPSS